MSDNAEARARAKRWVADQDTNPPLELAFFSGFEEGQALLLPEIAALREAVRYCYDEGKLTREVEDAIDLARGRRALEEKP